MGVAYKIVAQMHNSLKVTKPLSTKTSHFFDRPYSVIRGDIFAREIKKKIKEPTLNNLRACIGSVNQLTNSVDLLDDNRFLKKMEALYK